MLIARRTGVTVWVGSDRVAAAAALLHAHPTVDLIISDDGLQHLALARDLELCVFDERGVGNGWLMPAGPLREPWPRAASTHTPCLLLLSEDATSPPTPSLPMRCERMASSAAWPIGKPSQCRHSPASPNPNVSSMPCNGRD